MERGDSSGDWVITVPAFEVHNGFWYKLIGSEASTDEYRIEVRSAEIENLTGKHHRLMCSETDPECTATRFDYSRKSYASKCRG